MAQVPGNVSGDGSEGAPDTPRRPLTPDKIGGTVPPGEVSAVTDDVEPCPFTQGDLAREGEGACPLCNCLPELHAPDVGTEAIVQPPGPFHDGRPFESLQDRINALPDEAVKVIFERLGGVVARRRGHPAGADVSVEGYELRHRIIDGEDRHVETCWHWVCGCWETVLELTGDVIRREPCKEHPC
jgi:hypothetical protein